TVTVTTTAAAWAGVRSRPAIAVQTRTVDADPEMRIGPANPAPCADLDTMYGERGSAQRCRCQRYNLHPGESFRGLGPGDRAARQREQPRCGDSPAAGTSGLVAYLADTPVGWCAVEPRPG